MPEQVLVRSRAKTLAWSASSYATPSSTASRGFSATSSITLTPPAAASTSIQAVSKRPVAQTRSKPRTSPSTLIG